MLPKSMASGEPVTVPFGPSDDCLSGKSPEARAVTELHVAILRLESKRKLLVAVTELASALETFDFFSDIGYY